MFELRNKTIIVLSPQAWGKMFISKHHYAVELAKLGNTVYFLNPPEKELTGRLLIESTTVAGLSIIRHRLNFSYNIKFRSIRLFHFFMRYQVNKILEAIPGDIDIIWSFDSGYLYPLSFFPEHAIKIYHPVDEPSSAFAIKAAKGADIIFSVTTEILEKFEPFKIPLHFVNHGVIEDFFYAEDTISAKSPIRVGFSGNLLRPDIDTDTLLKIFRDNPSVIFECWGSYRMEDTNIGGNIDNEKARFIESIQKLPNVILHGVLSSQALAAAYRQMHAFLICYDINKDQSKGTNYHKIMEYLASGSVVISNNVTTYKSRPELIQMTTERGSNAHLPDLFKNVINNIEWHNSIESRRTRISFAKENLYTKQVSRIEVLLRNLKTVSHSTTA